jgi:hypothetical protein
MNKKNLKVEQLGDGFSRVSGRCVFTGESYECTVPTVGLQAWQSGAPIQWALPDVPAEEREFLISGISPSGWQKTFGD